jgi:hypothetical protein
MAALSQLSYSPFEIEVTSKGNTRALPVARRVHPQAIRRWRQEGYKGSVSALRVRAPGGAFETTSDADQSGADSDQTCSDVDQTASDRDQRASDRDQQAADRDQADSDR